MDFSQDIKRNHHFVFQRYLEEWIDPSKNELWVLMEKKKLFSTGTAGAAFKRSFYTIKGIDEEEKKIIKLLYIYNASSCSRTNENYNKCISSSNRKQKNT